MASKTKRKPTKAKKATVRKVAPPAGVDEKTGSAQRLLLWALLPALVAMALHLGGLGGQFVSDDYLFVVDNPLLQQSDAALQVWRQPYPSSKSAQGALFRPLTLTSYVLDHGLYGLKPLGFHISSLLMHGLAAWLATLACAALTPSRRTAIAAGLLFAVHPIHVEVVCWVSGRAEALAALGCLTALLLWAQFKRHGRARWAALSALAYLLALTAKETAVPLPLAVLLIDWCGGFGPADSSAVAADASSPATTAWRRMLRPLVPYAAFVLAFVAYFTIRWAAVGRLTPSAELFAFATDPPGTRFYTGLAVIGRYLSLHLWPHPLRFDYSDFKFVSARAPEVFFGGLVLLGSTLALWRWRRRRPVLASALSWFLCFLLPVCHLLLPIGAVLAERFAYIASFGICVLGAALYAPLLQRGKLWLGVGAAVLLALGAVSVDRSRDWRSAEHLFEAELERDPGSEKAILSIIRIGRSRFERTGDVTALRRADALAAQVMEQRRPGDNLFTGDTVEIAIAYADTLLRRGDVDQALAVCQRFDRLLKRQRALPPRLRAQLAYQLGLTHEARGENPPARFNYLKALKIWPDWSLPQERLKQLQ